MEKVRILFLSANPWTTSRILVDKEAREIHEKLEEGPHRDRFELVKHAAIRPGDLQRLLMKYQPNIVHFSCHGSKARKIILEGAPGRGKLVDPQGLVEIFRLCRGHVRLVLLNACFTKPQARALTGVVDYSIGIDRAIGDKAGVAFAGAFYRALGFGKPVPEAFASAQAELRLTRTPRSRGIELFIREGLDRGETLSQVETNGPSNTDCNTDNKVSLIVKQLLADNSSEEVTRFFESALVNSSMILKQTRERIEGETRIFETSVLSYFRFSSN